MKITTVITAMAFLMLACNNNPKGSNIQSGDDSTLGMIIADTIIYNVNIINHNPDDLFGQQSLKGLKREILVSQIFDMINSGKAIAFDHTTGEKMTPGQLQRKEASGEINRENIDMIQFKEIWYLNTAGGAITKKVISMVLGTQVFDSYRTFIANKAVLRVELHE